jgi:hypothetical protein
VVEANVNHILNLPALIQRGLGAIFARRQLEVSHAVS